jgi:hypothetical protein
LCVQTGEACARKITEIMVCKSVRCTWLLRQCLENRRFRKWRPHLQGKSALDAFIGERNQLMLKDVVSNLLCSLRPRHVSASKCHPQGVTCSFP